MAKKIKDSDTQANAQPKQIWKDTSRTWKERWEAIKAYALSFGATKPFFKEVYSGSEEEKQKELYGHISFWVERLLIFENPEAANFVEEAQALIDGFKCDLADFPDVEELSGKLAVRKLVKDAGLYFVVNRFNRLWLLEEFYNAQTKHQRYCPWTKAKLEGHEQFRWDTFFSDEQELESIKNYWLDMEEYVNTFWWASWAAYDKDYYLPRVTGYEFEDEAVFHVTHPDNISYTEFMANWKKGQEQDKDLKFRDYDSRRLGQIALF